MADTILILGPVVFKSFEIPENINFGGRQMLTTHRLIGGERIVDAMGSDHADPRWAGLFFGPDAMARARLLDGLRQAGAQIPLAWGGLYFQVVISTFEVTYEKAYQIPYRIGCHIVSDPTGVASIAIGASLDALVSGDLSSVDALLATAGSAALSTAVGTLETAVDAAGTLSTASLSTLTGIANTVPAIAAIASTASNAIDATLAATVDNVGVDPAALAASLSAQASATLQQSALQDCASYLGRVQANLVNASA